MTDEQKRQLQLKKLEQEKKDRLEKLRAEINKKENPKEARKKKTEERPIPPAVPAKSSTAKIEGDRIKIPMGAPTSADSTPATQRKRDEKHDTKI